MGEYYEKYSDEGIQLLELLRIWLIWKKSKIKSEWQKKGVNLMDVKKRVVQWKNGLCMKIRDNHYFGKPPLFWVKI